MSDDLLKALATALGVRPDELTQALGAVKAAAQEQPTVWQVANLWREKLGKPRQGIPCQLTGRNGHLLAPSTVSLYLRHLKPVLHTLVECPRGRVALGSVRRDEMTPETPDSYRATRRSLGIQDNTINREIATLMTMLTWDAKHGHKLGANPIAGYLRIDEKSFARQTLLSLDEAQKMYSRCPTVGQDIGTIMTILGMRPREAMQLLKAEVDRDRWCIRLTKRPGVKTGPRVQPIPDAAGLHEIINRCWDYSKGPYLFVHPMDPDCKRPITYETFRRWVRKSIDEQPGLDRLRRTDKRLSSYHSRHAGVNALASHSPIKDVSLAVGCSIPTMQESYLKFGDADQEAMRQRMNESLRKPPKKLPAPAKKRRAG